MFEQIFSSDVAATLEVTLAYYSGIKWLLIITSVISKFSQPVCSGVATLARAHTGLGPDDLCSHPSKIMWHGSLAVTYWATACTHTTQKYMVRSTFDRQQWHASDK